MRNVGGIARLGMLAVGLGIGAAIASAPGIAAADSSDWLSSIDSLVSGLPVPAADTSGLGLNLAISYDGATLFQDGTALADTGTDGDIAIANGAGAYADATGTNNYAVVDGTDSSAVAGGAGSTDDTAFVFGNDSSATAGGTADNPGNFDGAVIFGNGDGADAGSSAAGAGSYDVAYAEGDNLGTAHATGAEYLLDILKFYGTSTTSTAPAAESGNLLTDLVGSTDTAGAAADSSNLVNDLLGSFDPATAAADSGHLLADLASLF